MRFTLCAKLAAEVKASERIRQNARTSILVIDHSKFGRLAHALGPNIADIDRVVLDRRPGAEFDQLIGRIADRLVLAEGDAT